MKKILFFVVLFISLSRSFSQTISGIINTYARVTAIDVPNKILTFDNVIDPTGGTSTADFAVGKTIMIIQMKGAVINTANDATYGTLVVNGIQSAGLFEWTKVVSCSACTSSQIKVETLKNTYNVSGSVQIVSVPEYTNVTVGASGIQARDWSTNLERGGILVLSATGTVTLNGNISAVGRGFRGGLRSNNRNTCADQTTFRSSDIGFGQKGEGITAYTSDMYAKGALVNGGGGGNDHNGGGGGGGNYTSGGRGGNGWNGACGFSTSGLYGGVGGISLQTYYSSPAKRLFLGGGGGGGQQNNSMGGNGGNGGGIIFISANTLAIPPTCTTSYSIDASGNPGEHSTGFDAGGGGGAGGVVVLRVNNYNLPCAANPLYVRVNGGNGGNVVHSVVHGGGGGGGLGAIILTTPVPANMIITSNPGNPGLDCNGSCSSTGTAGGSCSIVNCHLVLSSDPLPIELAYFKVQQSNHTALLQWAARSDKNVSHFEVQKSYDLETIENFGKVIAEGNITPTQKYSFTDRNLQVGTQYYRIKIVNTDGSVDFSSWEVLQVENLQTADFEIYPNPTTDKIIVHDRQSRNLRKEVSIYNMSNVLVETAYFEGDRFEILLNNLPKGMYLIKVQSQEQVWIERFVVF
ncbi:MAG: T9SS type A sorting domain-containing protein [Bacteroidia bacterium]|nr:T9SS type A sorting domain-containing protein [Bacteroidia bacterium]MDW8300838.1 T9SS type A sorting domain-containing protein [Bacteroidia bacterium]